MIELDLLYNELEKNQLLLNDLSIKVQNEDLESEEINEFSKAIKELESILPGIKHSIKMLEMIHDVNTVGNA